MGYGILGARGAGSFLRFALIFGLALESPALTTAVPSRKQVEAAMAKATGFMMDTVSARGGFVWKYSLDLKERYGEIGVKTRDTMTWVQEAGTPGVGMMLIEAWKATGDRRYLEWADRAAGVLIWGQLPTGGWNYLIDFDPAGTRNYYETCFWRTFGWEEYLHYYGNATFDDGNTADATRFLMRLYEATGDSKYREPLLKALQCILDAQYPNGAWPQRWPLKSDFPHGDYEADGTPAKDYTACYTMNDKVCENNIEVLFEAARVLGREEYLQAARRGMDFYIIAQQPSPQAGWAQQYDMDMKPAWGRRFEINTVCTGDTLECIRGLLKFYKMTGDRRYLEPIPKALAWLKTTVIDTDADGATYVTYFYEPGTNRPIYTRRVGKDFRDYHFILTYDPNGAYPYGVHYPMDIAGQGREFERVRALDGAAARAEYDKEAADRTHPPIYINRLADQRGAEEVFKSKTVMNFLNRVNGMGDYSMEAKDAREIHELILSMDQRGAWVTDVEVINPDDCINIPPKKFKGYDTCTYIARMYRFINYLKGLG